MGKRNGGLSDLHMVVLGWIDDHPGASPEGIAQAFGGNVDEIEQLCADLAAVGFIEPTRLH